MPWTARWSAPDPKGMVDGPNLYQYVSGNPVRLVDPSGTESRQALTSKNDDKNQNLQPGTSANTTDNGPKKVFDFSRGSDITGTVDAPADNDTPPHKDGASNKPFSERYDGPAFWLFDVSKKIEEGAVYMGDANRRATEHAAKHHRKGYDKSDSLAGLLWHRWGMISTEVYRTATPQSGHDVMFDVATSVGSMGFKAGGVMDDAADAAADARNLARRFHVDEAGSVPSRLGAQSSAKAAGEATASRNLWKIERYDKTGMHPQLGKVYKDDDMLWVDLKGGHGGARWKVYQKHGGKWKLQNSADKYGTFMESKHESGKFEIIRDKDISWSGGRR